jgi:hypothetical protein
MASQIDPSFISTAPVSKEEMRVQLGIARDEITELQNRVTELEEALANCCGGGGFPLARVDDATLIPA